MKPSLHKIDFPADAFRAGSSCSLAYDHSVLFYRKRGGFPIGRRSCRHAGVEVKHPRGYVK